MSSWTTNRLVITGPAGDVAAFVREQEVLYCDDQGQECFTPLSFATSVPEPTGTLDEDWDWNDLRMRAIGQQSPWRVWHWGTTLDLLGRDVGRRLASDGTLVEYWFQSAWDAPDRWVAAVEGMYPSLTFDLRSVYEGEPGESTDADPEEETERFLAEIDAFWAAFYAGSDFECVEVSARPKLYDEAWHHRSAWITGSGFVVPMDHANPPVAG